jgi:cytochrome c oxidase subunit IV
VVAHANGIDGQYGMPDSMVTVEVQHAHKPTSFYVVVAIILAGLTALETSTYWIDFGPLFMPALLIMMTIKFFMVVLLFMHLKFDNRLFGVLFYSGLGLAVFVYIAALMTFEFFTP